MPTIAFKAYTAWQKRVQNFGASADAGSTWALGGWLQS